MDYPGRLKKLQKKLRTRKLDGLLVTEPHNRRYLSGFSATDHNIGESSGALLIPARGQGVLLTDFRYQLQAEQEAETLSVEIYKRGLTATLAKILPEMGITALGFESDYMLFSTHGAMTKTLVPKGVRLEPVAGLVETMRLIKEPAEVELIRRSVVTNEQVFTEIFPTVTPTMTEMELALALEQRMRQLGASEPSFATIVASGGNSALPHAVPGLSPVKADQPLTIDMGLVLDGYCSDMTRTFVPGAPSNKYIEIHRIVRRAQLAAMAAIRPGVTAKSVDRVARQIIDDAGYGKCFGHSLGHGVGLNVHEDPRLSPRSAKKLKAGMIVTVEPGIYIPGWGGVRLENMVLVTDDGAENLNRDTTWLDL